MTDDEREDKKIIHISELLSAIETGDYTEEPDADDFSPIDAGESEEAGPEDVLPEEEEPTEPEKKPRRGRHAKKRRKRSEKPDDGAESADGEEPSGGEEAGKGKKPEKQRKPGQRGLIIALALVVILGGLLVFAYGDKLFSVTPAPAQETSAPSEENLSFTYENGSNQTFALVGDGLAIASESGFELLDSSGKQIFRQVCSPESPAAAASSTRAVFYDVGGTICTAVDSSGGSAEISGGSGVISASASESGHFAVITENAGTKGLVSVYNSDAALIYEWYSGSGYPLRAEVSPDGSLLAVLTVDADGSRVHLFKLTSEEELSRLDYDGELLFDLKFMSSRTFAALGSDVVYFGSTAGEKTGEFGFSGRYLAAYSTGGSGYIALFLSTYRTGTGGELISVDDSGAVLGSVQTESDISSVSASGRHILAVRPDGLELYSPSMAQEKSEDMLITAKRVVLRPRGDVLLLSLYGAERFSF